MNQNDAPIGTVAVIGHPANELYAVKYAPRAWRWLHNGKTVDPEDFRAGWNQYLPVTTPAAEDRGVSYTCTRASLAGVTSCQKTEL